LLVIDEESKRKINDIEKYKLSDFLII